MPMGSRPCPIPDANPTRRGLTSANVRRESISKDEHTDQAFILERMC